MKFPAIFAIAAGVPVLLSACAASDARPMNTGERISQRGGDIGNYGQAWSDGQRDVAQGQKAIEKSTRQLADSERDLARARQQVARAEQQIRVARDERANGEKLIQDGNGRMQRAEAGYSAVRAGPSAVTP